MATVNFTNTNDPWSSFDTQPIVSEPGSQALDPARLTSTLDQILRTSSNEFDATMRWTDLVRQATGAKGVLLFGPDTNGELSPIPVCKNPSAIAESAISMLHGLSMKAVREAAVQFAQAGTDSERIAAAVPVIRADRQPESLVVFVPMGPHEPRVLATLAQVLQFLAGYAGAWRGNWEPFQTIRQASPIEVASDRELSDTDRPGNASLLPDASSQRFLETMKLASASSSIGEAAEIWCRYIADGLDARMMAIGLTRRSGICRLMAMAPCYQFDRNAPLVASLESVMSETLLRMDGESIEVERRSTEATRILREQTGASHVYSHVLRDGRQQAIGVCLLLAEAPLSESRQKSWRKRNELSGTHLGILRQSAPSYLQVVIARWRSLTGHQKKSAVAALILAFTGMAAIPLPYRLTCRAEIQPVDRRYVATPYEGRLERAFVHPGDLVTRGQLVARMDGRELRLEMAGIDSERERISKERDRAIVMGDTASAQLALMEVQRLDLRRQMFQTRLENLEVRSPVDGVVISGEPKKLEGARLNQGQSLVEIGSLGEMALEIAIPDSDIEQAEVGRAVKCQLDSNPGVPIRGVLMSIQPRSELRDAGNVFVGRVELESTTNELRPGMRGRARLSTAPQSLAWILFHRIWEQLLFRVGW